MTRNGHVDMQIGFVSVAFRSWQFTSHDMTLSVIPSLKDAGDIPKTKEVGNFNNSKESRGSKSLQLFQKLYQYETAVFS
jgi:hypothetical protein